jgi:hypothetical protein
MISGKEKRGTVQSKYAARKSRGLLFSSTSQTKVGPDASNYCTCLEEPTLSGISNCNRILTMGRLSTAKYFQLPQETLSTTDFPQGASPNTDCDIESRHRLHAMSLLEKWMMPLLFIGCALLSSGLTIVVMRDGATDCHPVQIYEKSQLMRSPVPERKKSQSLLPRPIYISNTEAVQCLKN